MRYYAAQREARAEVAALDGIVDQRKVEQQLGIAVGPVRLVTDKARSFAAAGIHQLPKAPCFVRINQFFVQRVVDPAYDAAALEVDDEAVVLVFKRHSTLAACFYVVIRQPRGWHVDWL